MPRLLEIRPVGPRRVFKFSVRTLHMRPRRLVGMRCNQRRAARRSHSHPRPRPPRRAALEKAESELDELRLRHATDSVVAQRETRPVVDYASIEAVVRKVLAEGVQVTGVPDPAVVAHTKLIEERGKVEDAFKQSMLSATLDYNASAEQRHLEMVAATIRSCPLSTTLEGAIKDARALIAACRREVAISLADSVQRGRDAESALAAAEARGLALEDAALNQQEEEHYKRKAVELDAKLTAAEARIAAAQIECFAVGQWSHEAKEAADRIEAALKGEP